MKNSLGRFLINFILVIFVFTPLITSAQSRGLFNFLQNIAIYQQQRRTNQRQAQPAQKSVPSGITRNTVRIYCVEGLTEDECEKARQLIEDFDVKIDLRTYTDESKFHIDSKTKKRDDFLIEILDTNKKRVGNVFGFNRDKIDNIPILLQKNFTLPSFQPLPPFLKDDFLRDVTVAIEIKNSNKTVFAGGVSIGCYPIKDGSFECFVLTAEHVVDDDRSTGVLKFFKQNKLNGVYSFKIIGRDASKDLALLKVVTDKEFPSIDRIAPPDYELENYDRIIQVGYTEGKTPAQIFAAKNYYNRGMRHKLSFDHGEELNKFIECNRLPTEGESGGPLFSRDGRLIGIASFREEVGENVVGLKIVGPGKAVEGKIHSCGVFASYQSIYRFFEQFKNTPYEFLLKKFK